MRGDDKNAPQPCPFCGQQASFGVINEDGANFGAEFIDCSGCGASTNLVFPCMGDVKRELLERWNKRVAVSHVAAPRPELITKAEETLRMIYEADGTQPIGADYWRAKARYFAEEILRAPVSSTRLRGVPSMDDLADGWSSWDAEERAERAVEKGRDVERFYKGEHVSLSDALLDNLYTDAFHDCDGSPVQQHLAGLQAVNAARSARAAPAWIKISEREPPVKELVLVIHDGRKITKQEPTEPCVGIGYRDDYPNPKWCVCKNRLYMYFGCLWPDADSIATWGEVTHWQPLPSAAPDGTASKP